VDLDAVLAVDVAQEVVAGIGWQQVGKIYMPMVFSVMHGTADSCRSPIDHQQLSLACAGPRCPSFFFLALAQEGQYLRHPAVLVLRVFLPNSSSRIFVAEDDDCSPSDWKNFSCFSMSWKVPERVEDRVVSRARFSAAKR
jgi:hypothetical protein